jgi:O-antigen biosynthesis protein
MKVKQTLYDYLQSLKFLALPFWGAVVLFPSALRLSGSIPNLFRKIYAIYQRDGLKGVYLRVSAISGARVMGGTNLEKWLSLYNGLSNADIQKYKKQIANQKTSPLISIVMPVYNPKLEWLREALDSVRNQIYPHWELCIVDDASTTKGIRETLEQYANLDPRIKVHFCEKNGHISVASNIGIEMASGEWIALLDHDDILSAHALFWVSEAMNHQPNAFMFYSDEAKIAADGAKYHAYFKPDWNIDLFLSHNMVSHLGVYKASVMRDIGGFRVGYEGAQDYDLALRFIEKISPKQIHHIPRILYYWRAHDQSTASSGDAKSYASVAAEKALKEYFERQQVNVKVWATQYGFARSYAIPDNQPLVSLIIPTRNAHHLVKQCIDSILNKTDYQHYEIILVDNNSDDPEALSYFESLSNNLKIRVSRDEQDFNYSAINNDAVAKASGELICLVNNDIEVINSSWLSEMVGLVVQPNVGAVGAKLLYPDDRLQHAGVVVGLGGVAGHSHKYLHESLPGYFCRTQIISAYSAVTGACLMVKKAHFEEVGGLDASNLKIAFNDIDFCLKLCEKGYRNVWTPYAKLYHHESATRGAEDTPEKVSRFNAEAEYMKLRWGDWLEHDPAYSPNLTLHYEDFSYAWPPRV